MRSSDLLARHSTFAIVLLLGLCLAAAAETGPPVGACCSPTGTCVVTTQQICEDGGREYLGDGTDCDPNPCNVPFGACCFPDTTCEIRDMADCAASGGIFQGEGSECSPFPCVPIGACCLFGDLCSIAERGDCVDGDGEYLGDGTTCELFPCNPVGAPGPHSLPRSTRLGAPFPNPTATGVVRCAIELSASEWVRVRIVDVAGRIVAEPVRERLPRGIHVFTWDAPSSGVSSGIYFAHLEAGGVRDTRKIALTE